MVFEWLIGAGGWRTGVSNAGPGSGFHVLGAGGELLLGMEFSRGLGFCLSGRILAGRHLDELYLEGMGGIGLHLRLSDAVRLRGGPAAGQMILGTTGTVLVGG